MVGGKQRVLVMGIDAGTFDIIRPMMEQGDLPVMAGIANEGVARTLTSTIPPSTPSAWTSSLTGMWPWNHNIFDFFDHSKGNFNKKLTPVDSTHRKAPAVWEMMSGRGLSVNVINVPITFPPDRVNGNMIAGALGTPSLDSMFTYPERLKARLLERFPDFMLGIDDQAVYFQDDGELARQTVLATKQCFDVARMLEREEPADFTMLVLDDIDRLQHYFWRYHDRTHPRYDPQKAAEFGESIKDTYRLIDRCLGEFIDDHHSDSAVIVYSDHGAGPLYKNVHINNLLLRHGYLKLEDRRWLTSTLRKAGLTKENIKALLRRLGLLGILRHVPAGAKEGFATEKMGLMDIAPSVTKAFSATDTARAIDVNLKGRYTHGTVGEDEYDGLVNGLRDLFMGLEDPETGKPVVRGVLLRSETEGAYAGNMPDLVLDFDDGYIGSTQISDNTANPEIVVPAVDKMSGTHRKEGIFMARGAGIKSAGFSLEAMDIVDVAPLLLYLSGVPVPEGLDGRLRTDMFIEPPDASAQGGGPAVRSGAGEEGYSEEDSEAVVESLRNLGYIE